jgi:hypothetical protein
MALEAKLLAAIQAIGADIKALIARPVGAGHHALEPGLVSGRYLSGMLNASALTTIATGAGRLDFMPFIPAKSITINELAIEVTTLVAAGQGRLAIYGSTASGNPGNKLVEGAAVFTTDAVGIKTLAIANTTLTAGTVYWLAVHSSAAATYRGIQAAALQSLGHDAALNAVYTLQRANPTIPFANGLPAAAPATTLTASVAVWLRMKIA